MQNALPIIIFLFLPWTVPAVEKGVVHMCDADTSPNWQIFCTGHILEAVNTLGLFNDSKDYVDMSLRASPDKVMKVWNETFQSNPSKQINKAKLQAFLEEYFLPAGSELMDCTPIDWTPNPLKISKILDPVLKQWALKIHGIWKDLCKQIRPQIAQHPDRYSLLDVPYEFIAPGGRFREFYYWDAYWIIKGLIVSEMYNTTQNMIRNLAHMVERFGFVPNGGRVYYLQRSQPPMLIPMVYEYYEATNDKNFLREILPVLEKELDFWHKNRTLDMSIKGRNVTVFRYRTNSNVPRPEAYMSDVNRAQAIPEDARPSLWKNLASTAESGWDFSSRWCADHKNITTIQTTHIIPVDLNAIICGNYDILAHLYGQIGNIIASEYYNKKRLEFKETMEMVFYDNTVGAWFDYNLDSDTQNTNFYLSTVTPLFAGCYDTTDQELSRRLYAYMESVGAFNFTAGIPTGLIRNSGEQWDFPYAWPHLNHMAIEAFRKSGSPEIQNYAFKLAEKWIAGNYEVYEKTGLMWEKYDVDGKVPLADSGGEYTVQVGFGWTNGVILDLLNTYHEQMTIRHNAMSGHDDQLSPRSYPIYVGNLPREAHVHDVESFFRQYGSIKSLQVKSRADKTRYALIEYENEGDARYAASRDGYIYYAKRLTIEVPVCRIYVTGLPKNIGEYALHEIFAKYGSIKRVRVGSMSNSTLSYGVIEYCDPVEAEEAVWTMNKQQLEGSYMEVTLNPPQNPNLSYRQRRTPYRLLVTGLPVEVDQLSLRNYMSRAGEVCYARVTNDGFGFVEFRCAESLDSAVEKLNGSQFPYGEYSFVIHVEREGRSAARDRTSVSRPNFSSAHVPETLLKRTRLPRYSLQFRMILRPWAPCAIRSIAVARLQSIRVLSSRQDKLLRRGQEAFREKRDFLKERSDQIRDHEFVRKGKIAFQEQKDSLKERSEQIRDRLDEAGIRKFGDKVVTIPNGICVMRIALTPVIGALVVNSAYIPACFLFTIAGLSDMLDGYIARNVPGQKSSLGSILDPVADKLLVSTLFVTLTYAQLIPLALTSVVIFRDVCLITGGFYKRYQTVARPITFKRFFDPSVSSMEVTPTLMSKINTVLQLSLVALSLASPVFDFVDHPGMTALCVATGITTVYSGVAPNKIGAEEGDAPRVYANFEVDELPANNVAEAGSPAVPPSAAAFAAGIRRQSTGNAIDLIAGNRRAQNDRRKPWYVWSISPARRAVLLLRTAHYSTAVALSCVFIISTLVAYLVSSVTSEFQCPFAAHWAFNSTTLVETQSGDENTCSIVQYGSIASAMGSAIIAVYMLLIKPTVLLKVQGLGNAAARLVPFLIAISSVYCIFCFVLCFRLFQGVAKFCATEISSKIRNECAALDEIGPITARLKSFNIQWMLISVQLLSWLFTLLWCAACAALIVRFVLHLDFPDALRSVNESLANHDRQSRRHSVGRRPKQHNRTESNATAVITV
ncbi:hypothetical protein QR680_007052 [Steinernema hermaphroditum]|uniref:Trehalase n=1 Tax=Steinernema hermaphroditum TaxID=289476 RepID=A0AA39HZP6_9BILA|nr:hypothetical protein QR680_007052 [Steinernema hermaphroditum]